MPNRGRDWNPRIKQRTVNLWRRRRTRKQIVAELPAWIASQGIDTDGRIPTLTNVIDWTAGVPRDGEPWDFTKAPREEVQLVTPVYAAAAEAGEPIAQGDSRGYGRTRQH